MTRRAPDGTPIPENFDEWEPWHAFEWKWAHGIRPEPVVVLLAALLFVGSLALFCWRYW